jgi:hypothetical protein
MTLPFRPSMSCTETCMRPPLRPTVPSRSAATASFPAIVTASSDWPSKAIEEERAVTRRLCRRENWLRSSSLRPSLTCGPTFAPALANGRTARLEDSTPRSGRADSPSKPASRITKKPTIAPSTLMTAMSMWRRQPCATGRTAPSAAVSRVTAPSPSSRNHASAIAIGKPRRITTSGARCTQAGRPQGSSTTSAICSTSHAMTA